jgi:hypothetical protein
MDAGMRKHRMTRWLGRLLVALSLVAAYGERAEADIPSPTVDAVKPLVDEVWSAGSVVPGTNAFPTLDAVCIAIGTFDPFQWGHNPTFVSEVYSDAYTAGILLHGIMNWAGECNYIFYGPYAYGPGTRGAAVDPAVCPTATPAYKFNPATRMCERPAQQNLTITLSGGTEVEPSNGSDKKFLPIIATVKDQNGQAPNSAVTVRVSLTVDPTSGGHAHGDGTRPRGGIADVKTCPSDDICWSSPQPTDGNGQVVFNFNPTETSGTHTITATCDGCSNTATKSVNVKVNESKDPGWDHLTASTDYALVGGETGKKHHDNHYLTATAREHLLATVEEYNTIYPDGPVLYLNDASLEWGGKFDIQGKWDKDTAHKNHRRGVVIDVRANQDPTAIPQARFTNFETFARHSGAYADLHCAFSGPYVCPACLLDTGPNRHYHVRLLGKGIDK